MDANNAAQRRRARLRSRACARNDLYAREFGARCLYERSVYCHLDARKNEQATPTRNNLRVCASDAPARCHVYRA
eukprot:7366732-Lingulodinium_polyedra.AAC.1